MVYGVGYCSDEGKTYSNLNDKCFRTWRNMLKRCYSDEEKYENYKELGITVCEEWLDFSNFKKWYDRNYYEIPGEEMQLDKDVITKGNNVYSPENCIFVPEKINRLYVKDKRRRGDYPIGVSYSRKLDRYISCCGIDGRKVKSRHKDIQSAFMAYKRLKENYAREIAEQYKNLVPERLYNAIMMFEVRIDD